MIPLGPFDLTKPIGRGGSCEVWHGIHREQGLPAAIKVVFGKKARTNRFISLFKEEVRAVAGLSHPSIVMVFDYGLIPSETAAQSGGKLQAGSPYLVMELGEETLHTFCDRLNWPKTYQILLSLLDGLAHAHARGVIHRDIKPANILVCNNYTEVKLSDFGLAHALEKDEAPRHAREIVGTPSYMAPEQFELRWRDYGPWTDLYAFGCTTYALLCGFPPFGRTEQLKDMMEAHLHQPIPRLPPRLSVPEGFEDWLRRLLHKDPARRFQRAADAAWALIRLEENRNPTGNDWEETRTSPFAPRPFHQEPEFFGEGEHPTLHTLHSLVGTPTPSVLPAVTEALFEAFGEKKIEPLNSPFDQKFAPSSKELEGPPSASHDVEETIDHPPDIIFPFSDPRHDLQNSERTLNVDDELSSYVGEESSSESPITLQSIDFSSSSPPSSSTDSFEHSDSVASFEQVTELSPSTLSKDEILAPSPIPPFPETWRREALPGQVRLLNDVGLGLYGLRTVPMVARESERDLLWSVLQKVTYEREGQVVCLSGPTGSGKSRLVQWLCERAHEVGVSHILKANHSPISGPADGFGAMLSRFLGCSGLTRPEILKRVEAGITSRTSAAIEEAHALVEIMSPSPKDGEVHFPQIRFGDPVERHEAIRNFIEMLGRRRSVIVWLDDIHWSYDSLSFISHVLRSEEWHPIPVLLVLTVREEALAVRPGEASLLEEILEKPKAQLMDVGMLNSHENSALVRELLGLQGELALQVEQCSAGNPLFAVQLVGDWVERGLLRRSATGFQLKQGVKIEIPDTLHQVWNDRIDRVLEGRTQDEAIGLEIAATLGIEVDRWEWIVVCEIAGVSVPEALLESLFGLRLAYGIEGSSQGSWSFVHSMLRESLERRAREAGRWSRHQQNCASMLARKKGPGMAERLGRHLLFAGDEEDALKPLLDGIWEHVNAGDFRRAELLFSEWKAILVKLGLPPGDVFWGDAWLLRCRLARGSGFYEQSGKLAVMVIRDARKYGWGRILVHALLEQANCGWRLGTNEDDVWLLLEEADLRASERNEPELKAECRRYMGNFLCLRGKLIDARKHLHVAYGIFEDIQNKAGMARCCFGLSNVERQAGHFTKARAHVILAQELYEAGGIRRGIVDCLNSLGDLARFEGDLKRSEVYYRESLTRYEALGAGDTSISKLNIALVLIHREHYDESQTILEELISRLHKQGQKDLEGIAHLCMIPAMASRLDWTAWSYHIHEARMLLNDTGFCDVDSAQVATVAGNIARKMGEYQYAMDAYQLAIEQWELLGRGDEIEAIQALFPTMVMPSL